MLVVQKTLKSTNIIYSREGGAYAFQAKFGWCIVEPVNGVTTREISYNWVAVKQANTDAIGRHHIQTKPLWKKQTLQKCCLNLQPRSNRRYLPRKTSKGANLLGR